jgi:hypothetical protein
MILTFVRLQKLAKYHAGDPFAKYASTLGSVYGINPRWSSCYKLLERIAIILVDRILNAITIEFGIVNFWIKFLKLWRSSVYI